ncbi:unnamed protein product [Paramecium sonneborni]|uniref:Uncharacterized protein n=1 Tax=Paramecium sonneborni TaxID=65129 RepID=A0A8S1MYB8_9CILI|nr:unnamed protein product [Paramecium sonneborni]
MLCYVHQKTMNQIIITTKQFPKYHLQLIFKNETNQLLLQKMPSAIIQFQINQKDSRQSNQNIFLQSRRLSQIQDVQVMQQNNNNYNIHHHQKLRGEILQ